MNHQKERIVGYNYMFSFLTFCFRDRVIVSQIQLRKSHILSFILRTFTRITMNRNEKRRKRR